VTPARALVWTGPASVPLVLAGAAGAGLGAPEVAAGWLIIAGAALSAISALAVPAGIWLDGRAGRVWAWALAGFFMGPLVGAVYLWSHRGRSGEAPA